MHATCCCFSEWEEVTWKLFQPQLFFQLTQSLKQRAEPWWGSRTHVSMKNHGLKLVSLAFQTQQHQFTFPASFLTSLFSYVVSLKLLKNTRLAAISEISVETCYFSITSLITGIYYFYFSLSFLLLLCFLRLSSLFICIFSIFFSLSSGTCNILKQGKVSHSIGPTLSDMFHRNVLGRV